jgi:adenosylcobyric acid synthase
MALNSFITKDGSEMGRAQVVQAEAAGIEPDVLMNPILLKPSTDKNAQVIVNGKILRNMSAVEYHEYKPELLKMVSETYHRLSNQNDVVVIEGAGSPAEINLRENDLVNMGMAEVADAPVVLVGDIDKGGVFASLYGTLKLLSKDEQDRIKGFIINKFRGDVEILKPGLKMLEDLTGKPVLGVVPYSDIRIEDEDSVTDRFKKDNFGEGKVNVEVLYLPHVSNFTDFDMFDIQEDVNLRYVMRNQSIGDPDILIIPGSKNTIEDLIYLKNSGLDEQILRLHKKGRLVIGICGGYQILGKNLKDPHHTESAIDEINGLGLLSVDTVFEEEKTTTQVEATVNGMKGLLEPLNGLSVKGYEIHMGVSTPCDGATNIINITKRLGQAIDVMDGATTEAGNVFGTYIHGIFDDMEFTRSIINIIREKKGLGEFKTDIESYADFKDREYNKLADIMRESIDMDAIYKIVNGEL